MSKRSRLLFSILALVVFLSGERSVAQQLEFDTYSEALDEVLDIGIASLAVADIDTFQGCDLTQNQDDLTVDDRTLAARPDFLVTQFGPIGPNLSRHCLRESHISGGSIVGGSLNSNQPTRTVSQFDFRRNRTKTSKRRVPTVQNFVESFEEELFGAETLNLLAESGPGEEGGDLLLSGERYSVFGGVKYENVDREGTKFESAAEFQSWNAYGGFAFRAAPSIILGMYGSYQNTDGTLVGPGDLDARDPQLNIDPGDNGEEQIWAATGTSTVDYEQACGVSRNGSSDSREFGASVFGMGRVLDSGFVAIDIGAKDINSKYRNSLCFLTSVTFGTPGEADVSELFSGVINGKPEGYQVDGKLRTGYDFNFGGLAIGPRIGLDLRMIRIGSYSEREIEGNASQIFTFIQDGQYPTGASLRYDDQDISSVQSRLGLAVSHPVPLNEAVFTPFAEFAFIHEFANNQRDLNVRFVEDSRADPLKFSFKTNAPDRNFFELGGGFTADFPGPLSAFGRADVLLGNSLYDSYRIEGGLVVDF